MADHTLHSPHKNTLPPHRHTHSRPPTRLPTLSLMSKLNRGKGPSGSTLSPCCGCGCWLASSSSSCSSSSSSSSPSSSSFILLPFSFLPSFFSLSHSFCFLISFFYSSFPLFPLIVLPPFVSSFSFFLSFPFIVLPRPLSPSILFIVLPPILFPSIFSLFFHFLFSPSSLRILRID